MKKTRITFILLALTAILWNELPAQQRWVAGFNPAYNMPLGTLSKRFESGYGGTIYFGKQIDEDLSWIGKIDYLKMDKVKESELFATRAISYESYGKKIEKIVRIPTPGVSMSLQATGVTINGNYKMLNTKIFDAGIEFGFGVYKWEGKRGAFKDSLFADTLASAKKLFVEVLYVPENNLKDYSGAFNLGLNFDINVLGPVWLNLGTNYKLIVGELWPALELNLGNVSGFQIFEARAGLKVEL